MNNHVNISFNPNDILFVLTINGSPSINNTTRMVGKILILRESLSINLNELSKMLSFMNIDGLHIFSINVAMSSESFYTEVETPAKVNYVEMSVERFKSMLKDPNGFIGYNKNSLYILRNGNYKDVKNILINIEGYNVSIGRGGSQKAHIISPLELRLSCYMMALSNFNYKYLSTLNLFNGLSKNRYLPYSDNK